MEQTPPTPQELLHKQLLFSVLQYLSSASQGKTSPTLGGPQIVDPEPLEVAIQCLGSAFGLDLQDATQQSQYALGVGLPELFALGLDRYQHAAATPAKSEPASLDTSGIPAEHIQGFETYLKMLEEKGLFKGLEKGSAAYKERLELAKRKFLDSRPTQHQSNEETLKQAEAHKNEGNQRLSAGKLTEALECYDKAIALNPNNAVYYANRAAALSGLNQHERAILDCKRAIEHDPKYTKAYNRLGFSLFSLGKYQEAIQLGYNRVLELDPSNEAAKDALALCQRKLGIPVPSQTTPPPQPATPAGIPPGLEGLSSLLEDPETQKSLEAMAGMFGMGGPRGGGVPAGGGGSGGGAAAGGGQPAPGPGAGGVPDIGSMMNNPALRNMAQQVMGNPQFSQLLNNPMIMNMANSLMQNPAALSGMLNQFGGLGMGGMGGMGGEGDGTDESGESEPKDSDKNL